VPASTWDVIQSQPGEHETEISPVAVFKSPLGHPEWCCVTSLQVWLEHARGPADACGLPPALTGPASRRGRQP
jgi:hypothetical protein